MIYTYANDYKYIKPINKMERYAHASFMADRKQAIMHWCEAWSKHTDSHWCVIRKGPWFKTDARRSEDMEIG
jgi:hypothetical protein